MRFGLFTEFHMRDGKSQEDAFEEHLSEALLAEELGMDSVWLAEYHLSLSHKWEVVNRTALGR